MVTKRAIAGIGGIVNFCLQGLLSSCFDQHSSQEQTGVWLMYHPREQRTAQERKDVAEEPRRDEMELKNKLTLETEKLVKEQSKCEVLQGQNASLQKRVDEL